VTEQWDSGKPGQVNTCTVCPLCTELTPFSGVEAVEGRDALDLGHQFGARQDGSVGIDAVHGLAEGQLLVVVGGMEEPSCGDKLQNVILVGLGHKAQVYQIFLGSTPAVPKIKTNKQNTNTPASIKYTNSYTERRS